MRYPDTAPAVFLARLNRFVARVEIDGQNVSIHYRM